MTGIISILEIPSSSRYPRMARVAIIHYQDMYQKFAGVTGVARARLSLIKGLRPSTTVHG
jgi:hypothetical protein